MSEVMRRQTKHRPFDHALTRREVLGAAAVAAIALAPLSVRAEEQVWTDFWGYALRGYDPVAYFTDGAAVEGDPAHSMSWGGAMWTFATAEHMAMFEADPEKFAPQFGGHCAWSMSEGRMTSIDPHAWDIVDGKLYLNFSPGMQAAWRERQSEMIDKAEKHWRKVADL